jgi:hypothetical protein
MICTVVKVDMCKSKSFLSAKEADNPHIREQALRKLEGIGKDTFPAADEAFPKGTVYKAEGDAIYYVLDHPTVALRSAIEFMQSWYQEAVPSYPDCRVVMDRGNIEQVTVAGKLDLVGKPFENISVFEKDVDEGRICLTKAVADKCDQTIANFVFYSQYAPRPGDSIDVFFANFSDPRTVADSSWIHALFIAHPKSSMARERIFELFFVECLSEKQRHVRQKKFVNGGVQKVTRSLLSRK